METEEKWRTIKLTKDVLSRLDKNKKSKSYNTYISEMLFYFDILNISPESYTTHPSAEIINRMERIIKIIRAIEKDKINAVVENTRICKEMLTKAPATETQKGQIENILEQLNLSGDEKITMDDFIRFIEVNKQQANEITELRSEYDKLKKQAIVSPPGDDIKLNSKVILELIQEIEKKSKVENGKFTIDVNFYTPYMQRIKDELQNVCESS